MELQFLQKDQFDKVVHSPLPLFEKLSLLAKMERLNTLFEVKRAGSGHLGSSFSAMDIVVYLYFHFLNIAKVCTNDPNRDIYFSSKGHDVPGFYAVLYSLGIIPEERFLRLRRLGGLDGHPDVGIPGVEANTGSLGMGISKGRGMVYAKQHLGRGGRVFVLTGDGEFQEGQNYEALQSTVQQGVNALTVIMDHNKLQSDRYVDRIVSLRDLPKKIEAFGWHVQRVNGNDMKKLDAAFTELASVTDKPKFLICDTIKGRGVSFMEHPRALKENSGRYKWHAGAPDDASFQKAFQEIQEGLADDFSRHGLEKFLLTTCPPEAKPAAAMSDEYVSVAYGKALQELAKTNDRFVVLDADLSADCKINGFEQEFPDRFVECGIAEQDMASMAGGIALQGLVPVVNSFATFLAARANEQVYNNQTEKRKIIYACHYAGLIPAGPGKSHQSIRDISLFGALPNVIILQAANADETRMMVRYAVEDADESCMLRINIGPSPSIIPLPKEYSLKFGTGIALTEGIENVLFAYGPVMLHEALLAADLLKKRGVALRVVNMPWLNRFDKDWLEKELRGVKRLFILEDHSPFGGLGDNLMDFMNRNGLLCSVPIEKFAVEGYPACGTPWEALAFHKLDGASLVQRVAAAVAS